MAVGRSYVRNPDIVPLRPAYLPRYPLPSCSSLPSSLLSLIPAEHYWVLPYSNHRTLPLPSTRLTERAIMRSSLVRITRTFTVARGKGCGGRFLRGGRRQ